MFERVKHHFLEKVFLKTFPASAKLVKELHPSNRFDYLGTDISTAIASAITLLEKNPLAYDAAITNQLRSCHVLLVGGFGLNLIKKILGNQDTGTELNYFGALRGLLARWQISHDMVAIHSEGQIADNGKIIAAAVIASAKPVVIIAHSKGGVDALEALMQLPRADLKKIRGFIAMQSPLRGSPFVDILEKKARAAMIFRFLVKAIGGDTKAAEGLRLGTRKNYLQQNAESLAYALKIVPTLAVATWIEGKSEHPQNSIEYANNFYLEHVGWKNDGLLPLWVTSIEGCKKVTLSAFNHYALFLEDKGASPEHQENIYKACLSILLSAN